MGSISGSMRYPYDLDTGHHPAWPNINHPKEDYPVFYYIRTQSNDRMTFAQASNLRLLHLQELAAPTALPRLCSSYSIAQTLLKASAHEFTASKPLVEQAVQAALVNSNSLSGVHLMSQQTDCALPVPSALLHSGCRHFHISALHYGTLSQPPSC